MSRIEMWKAQEAARIELEQSNRVVAYEHDLGDTLGLMDRPMTLGEFMEGHPNGFQTFLDRENYGEPQYNEHQDELEGYREMPVYRRDSALDELESRCRGGYSEPEVGPYQVELPIVFGTFRNNYLAPRCTCCGKATFKKACPDCGCTKFREPPQNFEEAFETAAWHFAELTQKYKAMEKIIKSAIRKIEASFKDENDRAVMQGTISRLLNLLGDKPKPVVLKRDPVIEDLPSQRDAECRWDHLAQAHVEEMAMEEKILRSTSKKYACFGKPDDDGNITKIAGPEERMYNKALREARDRRFEVFMTWVKKASKDKLIEAFCRGLDGSDGRFWAKLKASRNKCYPRSSKHIGDTLSSPVEVWLTKPQVDQIWGIAKARLQNK